MEYVTEAEYGGLAGDTYYGQHNRWQYYQAALDIIDKHGPFETVLEVGPNKLPLAKTGDVIDFKEYGVPLTYKHDVRVTPWPIDDKQYDLAVAFQVWEHLYNRQLEAFAELRRVARFAIMSFPLEWPCLNPRGCTNCHCGVTEQTIRAWVHGIEPIERVVCRDKQHPPFRKRLVYFLDLS